MNARVYCNGTRAKCLREIELTAGMAGAPIAFEFSPEWDGLTKIAVFSSDGSKDVILGESGETTVPHEILTTPGMDVTVAVFAQREDGTTWPSPSLVCRIGRVKFGADPSGDESYPPTPTVGEQAIALVGQAREDAKAAKDAAQAAEEAAGQSQADAESAANDAQSAKLLAQTATDASTKAKGAAQAAEEAAVLAQDAAQIAAADAEGAVAAANDVKSRADSGEFNGGYYAPRLEQEDGEAFAIGFTPSKEGMPSVESQPVQLPKVIMLEKGETVPDNLPPGQLIYIPDDEGITPEEAVVLEVLTALGLAPVVPGDDGTQVTADDGTVLLNL